MAASDIPAKTKKALYERDDWQCRHCKNRNGLHPHHIVYRSQGGKHTLDNLLTLCWKCHNAVHDGKLKIITQEVLSEHGAYLYIGFERLRGWKL